MEKHFCIMAGFDSATDACLDKTLRALESHGFETPHIHEYPFHLLLHTFPAEPGMEEKVLRLAEQVAGRTAAFPLIFSHLGVFRDNQVIFAAPDVSQWLQNLHQQISPAPFWMPHATLMIGDKEQVLAALPIAAEAFDSILGRVQYLHVYEFWPCRHVGTFELHQAAAT